MRVFTGTKNKMTEFKPNVLIVDDLDNNLKVMATVFEAAGAITTTINNPLEALKMVVKPQSDAKSFDLVVVDIHMPKMDGQTLAKELRSGGYKGAIIAVTAHPTMSGKRRGEGSGIDHFLGKPSLKPDLVRALLHQYCKG